MAPQPSPWFVGPPMESPASLRLFCFPYVGGSAALFRRWDRQLPEEVAVYGVALPGRGRRLQEAPLSKLTQLVDFLEGAIRPYLDCPSAFFGHSFGALLGYELARRLGRKSPRLLCVSGAKPPQLVREAAANHTLPDSQLVEVVRQLGGTPQAVLENDELVAALLPAIRADFAMLETYEFHPADPFDIPILVLGGSKDPQVGRDDLLAWGALTRAEFNLKMFPGGHFFIHQFEAQLLEVLGSALTKAVAGG